MRGSFALAFVTLWAGVALAKTPKSTPVALDTLFSAQFTFGDYEVELRAEKLTDLPSDEERDKYFKKHPLETVIGPGGRRYVTNGNHRARAAFRLGIATVYTVDLHDWSDLSDAEFWKRMSDAKLVRRIDENGREVPLDELSRCLPTISGTKDDPYRSLAWLVREGGGFDELEDVRFQEFFWADYFRTRLVRPSPLHWDVWVHDALALARSPNAKHLPGYHGKKASCPKILLAARNQS